MSDRMLSDEILLGIINSKSGGGGGGTDDYNKLKNQPQIGGNTLVGNKTASDLGLVAAETGKGLSTNDYTNADKAIVGGVTAALAGKQDTLTAGDYIAFNSNEISVNRDLVPHQTSYRIKGTGRDTMNITKYIDGVQESSTDYVYVQGTTRTIDDAFTVNDTYSSAGYIWQFVWLKDSTTHDKDYTVEYRSYEGAFDFTEVFNDEDLSGYKLVIKSEMDTALALKQDKTDNNLQTTDKTVVGAVNELKSGLTNYQTQNDLNLEVPNRKNLLNLKALYAVGSTTINIVDDTVTIHGISTWADCKDGNNNNLKYKAGKYYVKFNVVSATDYSYISVGFRKGNDQFISSTIHVTESGQYSGVIETNESGYFSIVINDDTPVDNTVVIDDIMVSPYDEAYTPYIPSVESRIEAVESGLTNLKTTFKAEGSATDLSMWANDLGVVVLSTYIAALGKRVGFKRAADGTISSYESDS